LRIRRGLLSVRSRGAVTVKPSNSGFVVLPALIDTGVPSVELVQSS
jgi:hypothetical protein